MALNLAWNIAVILVGSIVIGLLIDNYLNTKPFAIIIFSLLGIVGSLYKIIKEGLKK